MKHKSLLMMMLLCFAFLGVARAQELTVYDGIATNGFIPVYGFYADAYNKAEMIMPADDLSEMTGATISKMTWYLSSPAAVAWNGNFQVYLKEVDNTTCATTFLGVADATLVWEGPLDGTGSTIEIEFDNPYVYNGGNLFIAVYQSETGTYKSATFAGEEVTSASVSAYSYSGLDAIASGTVRSFLPKTTFEYTGAFVACEKPATLEVSDITGYGATFTWESNVGNYTFEYKKAADSDWTVVSGITTNTYTLSTLEPFTAYNARVKAVCSSDSESGYKAVNFTTLDVCPEGMVCIGDGTATNSYLPTYNYYNYSLTQQIYTVDELGDLGAIYSIAFKNLGAEKTRTLNMYMLLTDKSSFADGNDWVAMSDADLVFSGEVTFGVDDWTMVELTDPFVYDGSSNLLIGVADVSGAYTSSPHMACLVFDATSQAIRSYRDASAYDIADPGVTGTVLDVKNRLRMVIGEPPTCFKPKALQATEVTNHTATLSWTSNADAWQIDLRGEIIDVTENPYTLTGLTPETTYTVKLRTNCGDGDLSDWAQVSFTTDIACPIPTDLTVVPTPVSAEVTWNGVVDNYTLRYGSPIAHDPTEPATIILTVGDVWGDGSGYQMLLDADATAYGDVIPVTGALTSSGDASDEVYAAFEYTIPVNADGACNTSNMVVNNSVQIQIPAGTYDWCITNPTPGDRIWIAASQGNVGGRYDNYVFEPGLTYEFVITLDEASGNDWTDVTITGYDVEWVVLENVTSPVTLEDLTPETEYTLELQAVCGGEDGESEWIATTFITPSNCDAPSDLNVTDLTAESATLNWTAYVDGYEVRYRPVGGFQDGFENGLDRWTLIDADGDGYNWVLGSACGGIYLVSGGSLAGNGHNGSTDLATSGSYSNVTGVGALTPDNYLVSPQVELGGTITFWAQAQDANYAAEHFGVAVSTAGNTDASDFTTIQEWTMTSKGVGGADMLCRTMPVKSKETSAMTSRSGNRAAGAWYQFTVDLSEYSGMGYVAIRHFGCTDMFLLNVDDVVITGLEEPEWIETNCEGSPLEITDLMAETTYEWQVRGLYRTCTNGEDPGFTPWSELTNFTTPGYCDVPTGLVVDETTATTATLSWEGSQESFNVQYRTEMQVDILFYEDFSGSSFAFTTEDLGSANNDWGYESGYYSFSDGTLAFIFFPDSTMTSPQYLISTEMEPAVEGTILEFGAASTDEGCVFRLGFSSTDNTIASFTWSDDIEVPNDYLDFEVPEGTKYFAIAYPETNPVGESYTYFLDFIVYANYVPAGEWELVENVTSPVTLEGLTPETAYEWQVQGVHPECDKGVTAWSTTSYFQTLEQQVILISEIYIDNFVEPEWGANPDYNATVAEEDAPYTLDYMDWNWWSDDLDDGDILDESAFFDNEEYVYYAYFELLPEEGYEFADEVTVYVNGDPTIADYAGNSDDGFYWFYTIDYSVTAPAPVEVEQLVEISEGWNWWSTYLEADDALFTGLKSAIAENNTSAMIKSANNSIMLQGGSWQENPNNPLTLDNESMYMLNIENAVSATLSAMPADPAEHEITLLPGWNWIGFVSASPMSIVDAFAGITPNDGDMVKSSGATASYTDHWFNAFDQEPGKGYMYYNCGTEALTLVYPATAKDYVRSIPVELYWNTNPHRHATNLSVMATLDASQYAMGEGNYEIGAFCGDECRGSARLQQADGQYMTFMVVNGEPGETIRFKLYDVTNNRELGCSEETLTYEPNAIIGSVREPEVLHFRGTTSLDEAANSLSVYPNPAKDKVMIEGQSIETVSVFNALGQCLLSKDCGNADNVEINLNDLSAGVYTVTIRMNGQMVNKMIVKE